MFTAALAARSGERKGPVCGMRDPPLCVLHSCAQAPLPRNNGCSQALKSVVTLRCRPRSHKKLLLLLLLASSVCGFFRYKMLNLCIKLAAASV